MESPTRCPQDNEGSSASAVASRPECGCFTPALPTTPCIQLRLMHILARRTFEERGGSRLEAWSRASARDEERLETERLPANRLAKGVTLVVATKARFERAGITHGADSTCRRIGCVRLCSGRRHVCLGRDEDCVLERYSKGSHHRPEQPVRSERHHLRRVRVGLNDQRGAQRALHACQP